MYFPTYVLNYNENDFSLKEHDVDHNSDSSVSIYFHGSITSFTHFQKDIYWSESKLKFNTVN